MTQWLSCHLRVIDFSVEQSFLTRSSKSSSYNKQAKENVSCNGLSLKQIFRELSFETRYPTFPIFHKLKFPFAGLEHQLELSLAKMADGNERIHFPQKSNTSGLSEKKKVMGTAAFSPPLLSTVEERTVKKSYPQQFISY